MLKFDLDQLMIADILGVRSPSTGESVASGKTIRIALGSYTNHNAMVVSVDGVLTIIESVPPRCRYTTIQEYERKIFSGCVVRVWRVTQEDITDEERVAVCDYAIENFLGRKYPVSVLRLWVYRFVNNLPWTIKGPWCTRVPWDGWCGIVPGIFNRPDGKVKKNPTPRTFENRLVAGVIRDVTDEVLIEA